MKGRRAPILALLLALLLALPGCQLRSPSSAPALGEELSLAVDGGIYGCVTVQQHS